MNLNDHEEQQDRVYTIVNAINDVLAGFSKAEADTALTVAVCCEIIGTTPEPSWLLALTSFTAQASDILQSKEHTDFIRACIKRVDTGHA